MSRVRLGWQAMTLASLFFYPLLAALHDSVFYLQWRRQNAVELLGAFVALTLVFGLVTHITNTVKNLRVKAFLYFGIVSVPLISCSTYVVRQLRVGPLIFNTAGWRLVPAGMAGGLVLLCVALVAIGRLAAVRRMIVVVEVCLSIVSPINIFSAWTVVRSIGYDVKDSIHASSGLESTRRQRGVPQRRNVLVFLFDETSADLLYSGGNIRPEYPNFAQFSALSTNYHNAHAPGMATLQSLPGYLMGRRFDRVEEEIDSTSEMYGMLPGRKESLLAEDSKSLLALARQRGWETWLIGELIPYCEIWGRELDECRSISVYNYGGINRGFSLFNPILTNLILWPRQWPTGFVKSIASSSWEQRVVDEGFRFTLAALDRQGPVFLFVHFYLPHVPFIFARQGFYRNWSPFDPTPENYIKQLEYTDVMLGKILAALREKGKYDNSDILVLSDHNLRFMFPDRKDAIPLIVKKAGQHARQDVDETTRAEEVLKGLLAE